MMYSRNLIDVMESFITVLLLVNCFNPLQYTCPLLIHAGAFLSHTADDISSQGAYI